MHAPTYKRMQAILFLVSLIGLMASFYLQYILELEPCPLCLMQRLCVLLLCIMSGIACCVNKGQRTLNVLQIGIALLGLFFAFRQIWLQSLPMSETPTCMPEFNVLIRYFSWSDIARAFLWGASDCGEVTWTWLGFSLPAWTALYFFFGIAVIIIGLLDVMKRKDRNIMT